MAVVLFANSPHNLVRRPIYSHVVLIHRMIPTAWRTRHHLRKIHPRPMTMDQTQSSSGSSTNLMIHHSTQLGRLRKYATELLKGRRNHLQRIELSMDTTQYPLAVFESIRYPLNSETKQRKRSSTSPICPKGIARLHIRIIKPRHLSLNGPLFIPSSPCQHFESQKLRSRQRRQNPLSGIKQPSRGKTHPAGGRTTSPPMKQGSQPRPRHARDEYVERLRIPSVEQSHAQHPSTASKRTRTHPRERHPSANSKDEERLEWPTAG